MQRLLPFEKLQGQLDLEVQKVSIYVTLFSGFEQRWVYPKISKRLDLFGLSYILSVESIKHSIQQSIEIKKIYFMSKLTMSHYLQLKY